MTKKTHCNKVALRNSQTPTRPTKLATEVDRKALDDTGTYVASLVDPESHGCGSGIPDSLAIETYRAQSVLESELSTDPSGTSTTTVADGANMQTIFVAPHPRHHYFIGSAHPATGKSQATRYCLGTWYDHNGILTRVNAEPGRQTVNTTTAWINSNTVSSERVTESVFTFDYGFADASFGSQVSPTDTRGNNAASGYWLGRCTNSLGTAQVGIPCYSVGGVATTIYLNAYPAFGAPVNALDVMLDITYSRRDGSVDSVSLVGPLPAAPGAFRAAQSLPPDASRILYATLKAAIPANMPIGVSFASVSIYADVPIIPFDLVGTSDTSNDYPLTGCMMTSFTHQFYNQMASGELTEARVVSTSLLLTNTTPEIAKGGRVLGYQRCDNSSPWGSFPTHSPSTTGSIRHVYDAGLTDGAYGFLTPCRMSDLDMVPLSESWHWQRNYLVVTWVVPGTVSGASSTLRARVVANWEYATISNQYSRYYTPENPRALALVLALMRAHTHWCENPSHWERIKSLVGSITRTLKQHAPELLGTLGLEFGHEQLGRQIGNIIKDI